MSLKRLYPFDMAPKRDLSLLGDKMRSFYLKTPSNYYQLADEALHKYNYKGQPFHCHLAQQILPGERVIELGCGTAHFCKAVEKRAGIYYGGDIDPLLLRENRKKWPAASFFWLEDRIPGLYDMAISLYTIEHVVNPGSYLEILWSYVRPGGKIGIICPDFIDGKGIPPSVYFGITPQRLRHKFFCGNLWDATLHLYEMTVAASAWKHKARLCAPGAFWMNLAPRDLATNSHTIDGDAIHLPRLTDLLFWVRQAGGEILETSQSLAGVPAAVLRHNCYLLAKKPH
jgi:SAM-dependent methyltransferase